MGLVRIKSVPIDTVIRKKYKGKTIFFGAQQRDRCGGGRTVETDKASYFTRDTRAQL